MICYLGKYPENNHTINNEPIGKIEWQDLQGGMTVVNDLVERQGIPVFDLIDVALECATKVRIAHWLRSKYYIPINCGGKCTN